jgi:uncharacterized protein (DUF952 family)
MLIFKVLTASQWDEIQREGWFKGAPVDLADGYIHFSTAAQLPETLARHFAGESGLVVAASETDALDDALKWEPSRGGDLFPHLYRDLFLAEIVWAEPLDLGTDGRHVLPARVTGGRGSAAA